MKKVIVNDTIYACYDDDEKVLIFNSGDELEVLKEVESDIWLGGGFYVVYNDNTEESMTIAKGVCELVK